MVDLLDEQRRMKAEIATARQEEATRLFPLRVPSKPRSWGHSLLARSILG
jgi:hypothetical protein